MEQNFKFGNLTDVGLVRKANEDYYGCFDSNNGYVFVVCDGMGGHVGGAVASQTAVEAIKSFYDESHLNIFVSLQSALVKANEAILQKIKNAPELDGMGTTCVLLVIKEGKVYYAHIGDSRIYYIHKGQLQHITKDHSFVQSLVDEGHLTEAEAEVHPNKNQITKALGIHATIEPTVCEEPIIPHVGDYFLLSSDGLTGMTSDAAILEAIIEPEKTLQEKVTHLITLAKEGGGKDNITAQLIQFIEAPISNVAAKHSTDEITQISQKATHLSSTEITQSFNTNNEQVQPTHKSSNKWLPLLGIVLLLGVFYIAYSTFWKKPSNVLVSDNSTQVISQPSENESEIIRDSLSHGKMEQVTFGKEINSSKPLTSKKNVDSISKSKIANTGGSGSSADAKINSPDKKANEKKDYYEYTIQESDSISILEKKFKKSWARLKADDKEYTKSSPEPGTTIRIKTRDFFNYNNSQQKIEKISDALKNYNIKEDDLIFLNDLHVVLIPH
ncbi:MAG: Stp1/IreP family PP2C-type Ser/Thr phosphatase [Ginsengibacter sp.]|jgi:serine/threonine protein phosphatase PrpC